MSPSNGLKIIFPSGETRRMEAADEDRDEPFCTWLTNHKVALDTRCGGMGNCRGCLVEADNEERTAILSCQRTLSEAMAIGRAWRIPVRSLRNENLSGITNFEWVGTGPRLSVRDGIGLALDIGTTTLAATLWNLSTGECLAGTSRANPQRVYGDNVASRIGASTTDPQAAAGLHERLIKEGLRPMVRTLLAAADLPATALTEAVVAGNTVMLHTLAGETLAGFAAYPFRPAFLDGHTFSGDRLGLPSNSRVTLMANLGPFVGADITAGALAAGICATDKGTLLIDFGTNGELLLAHDGRLLTTATAVGPAFEGGRLSCGRTAAPGVIASLRIEGGIWQWDLCAGDGTEPGGISGAAYVDFLANARQTGLLTAQGRLVEGHPMVSVIHEDKGVAFSEACFVTEPDIAELIPAKAAIQGGLQTLLHEAGLDWWTLETVFISGGFGFHLNLDAAKAIGLLPPLDSGTFRLLGNSSLAGAALHLLENRSANATIPGDTQPEILELNLCPEFEDNFIDALALDPWES